MSGQTEIERLESALAAEAALRSNLSARVRELCALMQFDIDSGRVPLTDSRKLVLEEARTQAAHN